ncbi:glycosyltransferase [Alkalilimnicola ehrlichii]|uniref:glycosyltransferase n=1 Tax=Alkalilimnicola ehrlichii TaxID=351052 RepID=UPI003B9F2AF1
MPGCWDAIEPNRTGLLVPARGENTAKRGQIYFPLKSLVEAAACGRAVVTTDMPGCRDAIEPNRTGLLVPARGENKSVPVFPARRKTSAFRAGRMSRIAQA